MKSLVAVLLLSATLGCGEGGQVQPDSLDALRESAEQGDADAQFVLGGMYEEGRGVPQDYAEAVRWTRLSADQGHVEAQFNLGVMYETGRGVRRRFYVQAHMWFNLAAARATGGQRERAVEARDRVAGQMLPHEIAEAQRLAREWDEAHPREP